MTDLDDALEAVEDLHRETSRPVISSSELADRLGIGRRRAHDLLRLLEARGDVESHKIGSGRAWWAVDVVSTRPPAEPVAEPPTDPVSEPVSEPRAEPSRTSRSDAIEDALEGWSPGRSARDREQRKESAVAAIQWLAEQGRPVQPSELYETIGSKLALSDQKPESWWRTTVRPGVQRCVDVGLIEHDDGRNLYEWVGT